VNASHRKSLETALAPENGTYVKTLGAALYRVGRYEEALEALRRAAALNAATHGEPTPPDVAFLAMTHHRLGHAPEARAGLDVLRSRMRDPEVAKDPEFQAFLHEAEALIEPGSFGIRP
jgi:tetratricopeptide (TPR) repeat protein